MAKQPRSVVNITVAIAVHPPKDGEMPEVNVDVGQAGFTMPDPEDEEEEDDGDDRHGEAGGRGVLPHPSG